MYGDYGNEGAGVAPVNVGDELDVKIEAVGEKGDGIAKKDGFVLFVPNTRAGDEVKIRVTKVLRKVGFAEVVGKSESKSFDKSAPRRAAMPKPEPVPEDTEDFGIELEEGEEPETEEAPAEESSEEPEEAPAELPELEEGTEDIGPEEGEEVPEVPKELGDAAEEESGAEEEVPSPEDEEKP